jgi:hypothetical protein
VSALDELIQALNLVAEHLEEAGVHLATSRTALAEAEQVLTKLDPEHPETVVPPGLRQADDQIERTQGMIEHVLNTVRDFSTRL